MPVTSQRSIVTSLNIKEKTIAHLCTNTEGGSCEGVKRSSSAIKITGTGEHVADVVCGGT